MQKKKQTPKNKTKQNNQKNVKELKFDVRAAADIQFDFYIVLA